MRQANRRSYETSPVVTAAAGLFSLPTLALAMFRAVAPYYYALDPGGNMWAPPPGYYGSIQRA